jgi:YrbI family 3-deoxy-D-manno-octulosonate 8-phosphate phosphatase
MSGVLAIIPARGGSKGIPRKNVRPVVGMPLLAHSIVHARQAPSVTRIVVSTDDAEIAEVARRYESEVVMRPAEISGDTATSESALLHVLDHLRGTEGYEPNLVVFLQATSPLRPPGAVEAAITQLRDKGADSLFSASPVHGFVWRLHDHRLSSISYDYHKRPRRQDIGEDLVENGSIYLFKPWLLRDHGNRLGGKIEVFRMDPLDSFQVDEPGDLELMERLAAAAGRSHGGSANLKAVRLLILDFDGVMTDNRVMVGQDGEEAVLCHRGDGWGIARLKERGMNIMVISTEKNRVVEARCKKLGLESIQGCDDKLSELKRVAERLGVRSHEIAYVGNDLNDLECMQWVGTPIAVADAMPEILGISKLVTTRLGGYGAVREVADWLISEH